MLSKIGGRRTLPRVSRGNPDRCKREGMSGGRSRKGATARPTSPPSRRFPPSALPENGGAARLSWRYPYILLYLVASKTDLPVPQYLTPPSTQCLPGATPCGARLCGLGTPQFPPICLPECLPSVISFDGLSLFFNLSRYLLFKC